MPIRSATTSVSVRCNWKSSRNKARPPGCRSPRRHGWPAPRRRSGGASSARRSASWLRAGRNRRFSSCALRAEDSRPAGFGGPGVGISEWLVVRLDNGAPSLARQDVAAAQPDARETLERPANRSNRRAKRSTAAGRNCARKKSRRTPARNSARPATNSPRPATNSTNSPAASRRACSPPRPRKSTRPPPPSNRRANS